MSLLKAIPLCTFIKKISTINIKLCLQKPNINQMLVRPEQYLTNSINSLKTTVDYQRVHLDRDENP